jgi:hypothetical protein
VRVNKGLDSPRPFLETNHQGRKILIPFFEVAAEAVLLAYEAGPQEQKVPLLPLSKGVQNSFPHWKISPRRLILYFPEMQEFLKAALFFNIRLVEGFKEGIGRKALLYGNIRENAAAATGKKTAERFSRQPPSKHKGVAVQFLGCRLGTLHHCFYQDKNIKPERKGIFVKDRGKETALSDNFSARLDKSPFNGVLQTGDEPGPGSPELVFVPEKKQNLNHVLLSAVSWSFFAFSRRDQPGRCDLGRCDQPGRNTPCGEGAGGAQKRLWNPLAHPRALFSLDTLALTAY